MALLTRDRATTSNGHRRLASLTAAAARIDITDRRAVARLKAARVGAEWQEEAWDYYDAIPEIGQPITLTGNLIGQVRLYVGVRAEANKPPTAVSDDGSEVPPEVATAAEDELARLRGPYGGQSVILAETSINFDVAGECFLVGRAARVEQRDAMGRVTQPAREEEWDLKSVDEVKVESGDRVKVQFDDTGAWEELDEEAGDVIIRLWIRHPRRSWQARSALKPLLSECEAVLIWSAAVRADGRQRLANDVCLVPEELDPQGPPDPSQDQGDGEGTSSKLLDDLMLHFSEPIGDHDAASAAVPYFLMGKSEFLEQFRFVGPSRDRASMMEERIEKRVVRIARGLNLPPEVVLGFRETTFANATQVDQDTFDDFLKPRVVLICDALTHGFLRPGLAAKSVAPEWVERLEVWFDASELISDPAEWEKAKAAHQANALSNEALLRIAGLDPEADAPTPEELIARRGLTSTTTELLTWLAWKKILPELELPTDLLEARAEAAGIPAETTASLTAAARRRGNAGRRLMELDRALRLQLESAADSAMRRALERSAPARVATLTQSPKHRLHDLVKEHKDRRTLVATIGPALLADAGVDPTDLLAGAFDDLGSRFAVWVAAAQAEALEIAAALAGGLSASERATVEARQGELRAEAWAWLSAALTASAGGLLFNPDPAVPEVGEFDATALVPAGTIRAALALAGGASGLERGPSGIGIVIAGGRAPAGGIGTGQLVRSVLSEHGVGVEGYRWDYGPARRTRPFEPHQALHDVEFTDFEDDVLALPGGWPGPFAMPGDHAGCGCDVEPILLAPAEAAA